MTAPKPLFSMTVIARNEAKTLPVSLGPSLKEFFARGGDAVFVDTGSTDGTADIARSFGFRVFEEGARFRLPVGEFAEAINHTFVAGGEDPIVKTGDTLFDFSAARNHAASKAENEFVMIADCDEYFTALDIDALNKRIESGMQRMDIQFIHDHMPDGSPRIMFRRGVFFDRRHCDWTGVVHETIHDKHPDVKSEWIPDTEVLLQHRQIDNGGNRSSYIVGLAWECFTKPLKDRQSHYFGRELMYNGRYRSAIREFSRHIAMSHAWRTEQGQSMIYCGDCWGHLKDYNQAVTCWQTGFTMAPMRREALLRLAWNYFRNGDNMTAAAYASACLPIPWPNVYCDQRNQYREEPHELLYITLWHLGDKQGSLEHWKKARDFSPTNKKYAEDSVFYIDLINPLVSIVIPSLGRKEELKELVESLPALTGYSNIEILTPEDSFEDRQGCPKVLKQGVAESKGEFVCFIATDCHPKQGFLRKALECMYRSFPEADGLVGLDDGLWGGRLATHWLASKKLLPALGGEYFHTGYMHSGCDNELTARCKLLWKYAFAPEAVIDVTRDKYDEVHRLGQSTREADIALLNKRAKTIGFDHLLI